MTEPAPPPADEPYWPRNYYNYYTEIEDHFQRVRGTSLFLLSTLDWALAESWKNAGIPLEAALRGIDVTFEKWRAKKKRRRMINGLAFCTQAVIEEAERMQGSAPAGAPAEAPFTADDLRTFLAAAADCIEDPALGSVRAALDEILAGLEQHYANLEALELRLSALEDKMLAVARSRQSEAELEEARATLARELRPYRASMNAPQLAMLEKQYLDRWLFERLKLPRLSLFYVK